MTRRPSPGDAGSNQTSPCFNRTPGIHQKAVAARARLGDAPAVLTLLDVLRGAADYLEKKGVESPRLNAEHLLAHVLKKRRIELYMEFDRPLGEIERAPLRELVRARGEGRPLQHLLGTAEFMGREFLCDGRALIPRPETEQLVEAVLTRLPADGLRMADVGTGSGVIAISLALEKAGASITASDVSSAALELARENASRLGAAIDFIEADLLPSGSDGFDAVVANLPYIAGGDLPSLSREVRHDPSLALDGGPDGMAIMMRLIPSARDALAPGGLLALEIGSGQEDPLVACLQENNYRDIEALPDYQGHIRFLMAKNG